MKVKLNERILDCLGTEIKEGDLDVLDRSIQSSDNLIKGTLELLCSKIEKINNPTKVEIKENELRNLKTGTKLEIKWNLDIVSLEETHIGFFYNEEQKIIYDDDLYDSRIVISDSIHRNQCKVYAILNYGETKEDIMKMKWGD